MSQTNESTTNGESTTRSQIPVWVMVLSVCGCVITIVQASTDLIQSPSFCVVVGLVNTAVGMICSYYAGRDGLDRTMRIAIVCSYISVAMGFMKLELIILGLHHLAPVIESQGRSLIL